MPDPYSTLGLSCPSGGSFYICQSDDTEFIGCCTIDPCGDGSGSCPEANLRNASFSADSYDGLKPQICAEDRGLWYTCKYNKPPFLGCCASNPCASTSCPAGDLVPAKLSPDPDMRDVFLTSAGSSTPSSPSTGTQTPRTSSTATTGASSTTTAPTTNAATPVAEEAGARLSTGTIAGIAVGVAILVLLLVAGCVFIFRRGWHARKRKERGSTTPFLGSPPEGGFKSPVSSSPFTPYRGEGQSNPKSDGETCVLTFPEDSQAYTLRSNTVGGGSPTLLGTLSPPMSNYSFTPYNGTIPGDGPMSTFAGHVGSSPCALELGIRPYTIQELETEHNSKKYVRHELPADPKERPLATGERRGNEQQSTTPQRNSMSNTPKRSADLTKTRPPRTSTPRDPKPSNEPPLEGLPTPVRRSRESSINKDLPKTPPMTPPPVLVSPDTWPVLASRFSASRQEAVRGMNTLDSPTLSFSASPRRRMEVAALLSPETPGRPSGGLAHTGRSGPGQ